MKPPYSLQLTAYSLFLSFFALGNISFAQPISSSDLINRAKEYDGQVVEYDGEVVGDVMVRQKNTWINVNDGYMAIGIWAKNELIKEIKLAGNYHYIGDTVLVKGIFHRACLEHGGDLDIHADTIIKIKEGRIVKHAVAKEKNGAVRTLLFLLLATALMALTGQKKRKKYEHTHF